MVRDLHHPGDLSILVLDQPTIAQRDWRPFRRPRRGIPDTPFAYDRGVPVLHIK